MKPTNWFQLNTEPSTYFMQFLFQLGIPIYFTYLIVYLNTECMVRGGLLRSVKLRLSAAPEMSKDWDVIFLMFVIAKTGLFCVCRGGIGKLEWPLLWLWQVRLSAMSNCHVQTRCGLTTLLLYYRRTQLRSELRFLCSKYVVCTE